MKRKLYYRSHRNLPEDAFRTISKMRTIRYMVPALLAVARLASAQDFSALSSCAVGDFTSHVLLILQFPFSSLRDRSHDHSISSPTPLSKPGMGLAVEMSRGWLGTSDLGISAS